VRTDDPHVDVTAVSGPVHCFDAPAVRTPVARGDDSYNATSGPAMSVPPPTLCPPPRTRFPVVHSTSSRAEGECCATWAMVSIEWGEAIERPHDEHVAPGRPGYLLPRPSRAVTLSRDRSSRDLTHSLEEVRHAVALIERPQAALPAPRARCSSHHPGTHTSGRTGVLPATAESTPAA
jgi:hypothetical protein